jgi:3-methyl-2-oxobutanoate hydroxymethyltransferase
VVEAVSIPVLGGLGGGPWLDGRVRMIHRAVGYGGSSGDAYANVAQVTHDAIRAYADDVRAGRQVRGG